MRPLTARFLLVSFTVLTLVVTGCGAFTPGPADTATRFLRELEARQFPEALRRVSASVPLATLVDDARAIQQYRGIQTIETTHEDIRGTTAVVGLRVTYHNGSQVTEIFGLLRTGGTWQIQSAALAVAAQQRAPAPTQPTFRSGPAPPPRHGPIMGGIELTPPDSKEQISFALRQSPRVIAPGASATLTVTAQTYKGQRLPHLPLTLRITGGTLERTSGETDARGEFVTTFRTDPSDRPTQSMVQITATSTSAHFIGSDHIDIWLQPPRPPARAGTGSALPPE